LSEDDRTTGVQTESLKGTAELPAWSARGLSAEFDPFLPIFAIQVLRRGGEVLVRRRDGRIEGLLLHVAAEAGGSVFAADLPTVVALAAERAPASYFTEHRAATVVDELEVWAVDLGADRPNPPLRHRVRAAGAGDRAAVARLTATVSGSNEAEWIGPLESSGATCFVAELHDRIVGVGWAERAADRGRVHSVVVDPRYRGLGIGSDLLEARLRWLTALGGRRAISEVAVSNLASRRAAERSGLRPVSSMYLARFA
jgi:GNAT superfamily N-acetyltransferase